MLKKEVRSALALFIADNPHLSYKNIAQRLNCSTSTIATIARQHGIARQRAVLSEEDLAKLFSSTAWGK